MAPILIVIGISLALFGLILSINYGGRGGDAGMTGALGLLLLIVGGILGFLGYTFNNSNSTKTTPPNTNVSIEGKLIA